MHLETLLLSRILSSVAIYIMNSKKHNRQEPSGMYRVSFRILAKEVTVRCTEFLRGNIFKVEPHYKNFLW